MSELPSWLPTAAVIGGVALLLLILGWIATRKFSPVAKVVARLVLVVMALAPLALPFLVLEAPRKVVMEQPAPSAGQGAGVEVGPPTGTAPPVVAEVPRSSIPPATAPSSSAPAAPKPSEPAPAEAAKAPGAPATDPRSDVVASRAAVPPPDGAADRRASSKSTPRSVDGGTAGGTGTGEPPEWQTVQVYFGTDRTREAPAAAPAPAPAATAALGEKVERVAYGAGRAARLELGQALVTVPRIHQVPAIERPWVYKIPMTSFVIYAEKEDPRLHFTLQEVQALSREALLALVKAKLEQSRDYKGHALVFIHGYNTTFEYALYRTAQIAYDLGFDGAPFVYSWPSLGQLTGYPYDRESAEQAQPYLRDFLEMVTRETGATSVSIIAHSMGNQLLLPVLRELKRQAPPGIAISELILAAPDVGRDNFAFLAREIQGLACGVTLYASATDRALLASRQFWSGVRAGEVPAEGPFVMPGVDTIDVTSLSTEIFGLGHSGFAERTALISDIRQLIQSGKRPPETRVPSIVRVDSGMAPFWRFGP